MNEVAQYSVRDGIAVIALNNPPVNSLGHMLRAGIVQGLDKAARDPTVKALVLIGARTFSGGADIRELNTSKSSARPTLSEINDAQDRFPKPMIGAIGGFALGGGLELALGCHYRVAAPNAELALPEVKLGLLPGSGGTQRLPRAIPTAEALDMIVSGSRIGGAKARVLGLVDELIDGDLFEGALAYAKRLVAEGKGPRRLRDQSAKLDGDAAGFFAAARERVSKESRGYPAPIEIVSCVEAAVTKPFDEGLNIERERFEFLVTKPGALSCRPASSLMTSPSTRCWRWTGRARSTTPRAAGMSCARCGNGSLLHW
ncbi:MAG: enoyl-CoA hydratase/isomerase family protein, partial [Gammaproteobacteria bacterium]